MEKRKHLSISTHKVAKCILPGDTTLVCTHNIRRCILGGAKSRSAERRWRRARSRNGKKTENKKKRDTETRVDRRIETAAFSRTVNQVLTGDQIGRLVLSARKDGASGRLCFLFADVPGVSSFFAYFYCYSRRLGA